MDAPDPVAMVADIREDELAGTIRALSGADTIPGGPITSRDLHHPDLARAGDWLVDELSAIDGLVVTRHAFPADGIAPDPFDIVADLPGEEPGPVLLIGAHYDAIASSDPAWLDPTSDPAPGADDDASGVAVVLAIARRMAAWEPGFRRPVRFALWSGEEYGLLGSTAYVADLPPGEVGETIQLDSLGFDLDGAGNLWAAFDEQSAAFSDDLVAFVPQTDTRLAVTAVPAALIGGDDRSDHFPFWEAGIPALHFASFPLPPTYHTMDDTIAQVDTTFSADAARVVGAFAIARAEPRAQATHAPGCSCATDSRPVPWTFATLLASLARRVTRVRVGHRRPLYGRFSNARPAGPRPVNGKTPTINERSAEPTVEGPGARLDFSRARQRTTAS
jgi:hypothetical protein